MAAKGEQYLRKCTLLVTQPGADGGDVGGKALDLSALHIIFATSQSDVESPNNATIRVFNLSDDTVRKVRDEYSGVVLQAGYEAGPFGIIFKGTIKQFRIGRTDNKTTYLDILASDGDEAYNWAVVKKTLKAGSTVGDRITAGVKAFEEHGVTQGKIELKEGELVGGILPRGKVLFGLAKANVRATVQSVSATWSINNGKVNIIALDGYLPGEAVVLNSATGLIGRAEQTIDGIKARCLLNPKIIVGGSVKIDNESVNQTVQHRDFVIPGAQLPFNQNTGLQQFANVSADGLYRIYVAEYRGNTRGQDWYTDIVCLTIDPVTQKVKPYG